jgi:hypothetical protein
MYDLAGDIDRALDAQDADQPKFGVGDTVYICNEQCVVTAILFEDGRYTYRVCNPGKPFWAIAQWFEPKLTSAADWNVSQEQYNMETIARQQADAELRQHLEDIQPVRALYENDAEFEWAYVQWAESFWGVGDMPSVVRRLYHRYMLSNRWVITS